MEMLEIFVYATVTVVKQSFTDQNWISKTVYCIKCVMVRKNGFTNWNAKVVLLHAAMAVTYYIRLFWPGADRPNGILISLLFLFAETIDANIIWNLYRQNKSIEKLLYVSLCIPFDTWY